MIVTSLLGDNLLIDPGFLLSCGIREVYDDLVSENGVDLFKRKPRSLHIRESTLRLTQASGFFLPREQRNT